MDVDDRHGIVHLTFIAYVCLSGLQASWPYRGNSKAAPGCEGCPDGCALLSSSEQGALQAVRGLRRKGIKALGWSRALGFYSFRVSERPGNSKVAPGCESFWFCNCFRCGR
jgi:hypothetical protein